MTGVPVRGRMRWLVGRRGFGEGGWWMRRCFWGAFLFGVFAASSADFASVRFGRRRRRGSRKRRRRE